MIKDFDIYAPVLEYLQCTLLNTDVDEEFEDDITD